MFVQLTLEEAEAFIESLDLDVDREQFSVRAVLDRVDTARTGRISYEQAKQVRKEGVGRQDRLSYTSQCSLREWRRRVV